MRARPPIPALTPSRQALVDALGNLPEAQAKTIAKCEGALHLLNDLVSCARAAATRAAATYTPVERVGFADLAKHHIRGAVYDFLRHEARQRTFRRAGDLAAHQAYAQMMPSHEDSIDARHDDEAACRQKLTAYTSAKLSAITVALWLDTEATSPDPESAAAMRPFIDTMRSGVSGLRPSDRELLRCVYAEGMDLRTAAVTVGLAYPTAKVRHRKLLARLRATFDEQGLGPP